MHTLWVVLVFGSAFLLALWLLYQFHTPWYWHVLSVAAAFVTGLSRKPAEWGIPDLLVGATFVFLIVWGVGVLFVRLFHLEHHGHPAAIK